MKKPIHTSNGVSRRSLAIQLLLLLTACIGTGCEDEENIAEPIQVAFSFSLSENAGGRSKDLPDGVKLVLSVETKAGQTVFENREMMLLEVGGNYITDVIELRAGDYNVTGFMLVLQSEILYATPQSGSAMAEQVDHPLPYAFTVSKNNASTVSLEVVDVTESEPEDFGYTSFGVVIRNVFQIAAFVYENGIAATTAAKAFIRNGDEMLEEFDLAAGVNTISFKGDPDETFILVVQQDGYTSYEREFTFNDLKNELNNSPLKVFLYPAAFSFTVVVPPLNEYPEGYFQIYVGGESGTITVDWGDGTDNSYELTPYLTDLTHTFQSEGTHHVSVSGDLDQVISFYSYYGDGPVKEVDFSGLPNLEEVQFGITHGPVSIDLSHNTKLQRVELGAYDLEEVVLPASHFIQSIDLTGSNLGPAAVDKIIENIYSNAVSKSFTWGYFTAWIDPYDEGNTSVSNMTGPPTEQGLAKLKSLKDDYGWVIGPDIWQ